MTIQLALDVETEEEIDAAGDAQAVVLEHLFAACKAVVREMTADRVAAELNKIWANRGRGVTAQVLRAALADSRGNYFRVEWMFWFAAHSEDVRELLLGIAAGESPKDPADELADLQELVRKEMPQQAPRLIQKAKRPRVSRTGKARAR